MAWPGWKAALADSRLRHVVALVVILIVFAASVSQRSSYLGTLSDGGHQWLTAHSALIIDNWLEDGIVNDRALAIWSPRSILYKTFEERGIYASYPVGAQIPIFFIKNINSNIETIRLIHYFGLVNQILIALIIYIIVSNIECYSSKTTKIIFGMLASISYIVLPMPIYFHTMVYFADQAVILPFALAIFLEIQIRASPKKSLLVLQSLIIAWAAMVDYLAIPLVCLLLAFRLISPIRDEHERRNEILFSSAVQLTTPAILVFSIFILNIYNSGSINDLRDRFIHRTGLYSTDISEFVYIFFVGHLGRLYSICYFISLIFFLYFFYKERSDRCLISLVGLLTVMLQIILLRNHSTIHNFSALKFFLPLSFSFFGILPLILIDYLSNLRTQNTHMIFEKQSNDKAESLLAGALLILLAGILFYSHLGWHRFFPTPHVKDSKVAEFISRNYGFNDIIVGLDGFAIERTPPQKLTISRKIVHSFDSTNSLGEFIDSLPNAARLHFVMKSSNKCNHIIDGKIIEGTSWLIGEYYSEDDFRLLRCFEDKSL